MLSMITSQMAMIFSLIGATCVILSGVAKNSHSTHKIQVLDCSAHTIANILLEGWSGALATAIALVREVIATKGKMTNFLQGVLCGLIVVLGLLFNNNGGIGLLPVVASVEYTIIGCSAKANYKSLKMAMLISISLWAIYDLYIGAYPSFIADVITAGMCIYAMRKYQQKNEQQSEDC